MRQSAINWRSKTELRCERPVTTHVVELNNQPTNQPPFVVYIWKKTGWKYPRVFFRKKGHLFLIYLSESACLRACLSFRSFYYKIAHYSILFALACGSISLILAGGRGAKIKTVAENKQNFPFVRRGLRRCYQQYSKFLPKQHIIRFLDKHTLRHTRTHTGTHTQTHTHTHTGRSLAPAPVSW